MQLRREKHSVSRLIVHFVFVVKYRRKVISNAVWASLSIGFDLAAKRLNLVLVETNHDIKRKNLNFATNLQRPFGKPHG
jgi:REP element-mobilizing transposase RayT